MSSKLREEAAAELWRSLERLICRPSRNSAGGLSGNSATGWSWGVGLPGWLGVVYWRGSAGAFSGSVAGPSIRTWWLVLINRSSSDSVI